MYHEGDMYNVHCTCTMYTVQTLVWNIILNIYYFKYVFSSWESYDFHKFLRKFQKNNVSNAAIYNLKSWNLWRERITPRCFILSGSLENRPYIPHLFGIFQKILK